MQLGLMIIGFIFGDFSIMNPARAALQDGWIAFIFGWIGGFILIGIYLLIYYLNPSKTLIEILKDSFGKYGGSFLGILYIWYFIHISALVFRSFMEYMVVVNYPETPLLFPLILSVITVIYIIRSGLEVTARLLAFVISFLLIFTVITGFFLIKEYNFKNLLPVLENGWSPVISVGYSIMTFPFGELIVFSMIFPAVHRRDKLAKATFFSVFFGGAFLLSTILREILVLGPDLLFRTTFPTHIVGSLIPNVALEPILSTNLLISGGAMVIPCIYGALKGIEQVFSLEDYKPFIFVLCAFITSLTMWIYDSVPEMFKTAKEIYPYYSIPFQIVIPILVLLVSLIKKKRIMV